jgi:hypothetical protein
MDNQTKLALAKQKVDSMIGLPEVMLRKGVARSGNNLTGFTDYNYKLLRDEDRHWLFYAEWVDIDGEGYRVILPHPVVEAILRGTGSIIKQSRKEGGKKAAQNRKQKILDEAEKMIQK